MDTSEQLSESSMTMVNTSEWLSEKQRLANELGIGRSHWDNQSPQAGEGGSEGGSGICSHTSSGALLLVASSFRAHTEKEQSMLKIEFHCFSPRSLTM